MSPSRRQFWIAENRPLHLLLLFTTLLALAGLTILYLAGFGVPRSAAEVGALAGYLVVAAVIGYLVGGLLAIFILGPIYYGQGLENGAPYATGDQVRILSGRHRGRIVTVYEVWRERNQVRVDLDDAARAAVTDVFGYVEVCREHRPDADREPRGGAPSTHFQHQEADIP